jgi:hypothetical protein
MEKVNMSTATELKKANEMTNFKKYKAKVYEALAKDTYGLTVSQLATVCKLSAKTIKQILAELEVEKNGDVYLLKIKQPIPSTPQFPIYDNWLSKNMATLRQATAHLSKNDVNDIIEVAGRLIWGAAKAKAVPTWISLENDEPPIDKMVLICWADAPDIEPEIDYMTTDEDLNHIWANFDNDPPSHWMYFHKVPSKSGARE